MLEESRYNGLVAAVFKKLVAAADKLDPDILECDATGDMVTLTAAGGQKCIVNTQRAVRQIWVAGLSQGIHFDFDEGSAKWMDDKGKGIELHAWIARVVRETSGAALEP